MIYCESESERKVSGGLLAASLLLRKILLIVCIQRAAIGHMPVLYGGSIKLARRWRLAPVRLAVRSYCRLK